MSLSEATTITEEYGSMDVFMYGESNELHASKVSGGWICICKATLENNDSDDLKIASVDKVFCSDRFAPDCAVGQLKK